MLGLGELLDVDAPSLSVDLGNLSLNALIGTAEDQDLVILSDWKASDAMLDSKLSGEGSTEELVLDVARG